MHGLHVIHLLEIARSQGGCVANDPLGRHGALPAVRVVEIGHQLVENAAHRLPERLLERPAPQRGGQPLADQLVAAADDVFLGGEVAEDAAF
jgi:hypothetical protein